MAFGHASGGQIVFIIAHTPLYTYATREKGPAKRDLVESGTKIVLESIDPFIQATYHYLASVIILTGPIFTNNN